MSNEAGIEGGRVAAHMVSPEAEAVLRKQGEIANLDQSIAKVMAACREQDEEAARLRSGLVDVNALSRRLDELRALRLTGDASDDAVALCERQVAVAEEDWVAAAPRLDGFERMRAALARRLEGMRTRLNALKAEKVDLVRRFLISEAESECERYVTAAGAMEATYNRLCCLDLILNSGTTGAVRLHAHAPGLFIPRFELPACKAVPVKGSDKRALVDGSSGLKGRDALPSIADFKRRIQVELGIEIDG